MLGKRSCIIPFLLCLTDGGANKQEKVYNPYYTLVAQRLSTQSHSFQITLQYTLWDFLRELGEKSVGGEEMVKGISDDGAAPKKVSGRRVGNLARLYAWCVAKDALALTIFKVRFSLFSNLMGS